MTEKFCESYNALVGLHRPHTDSHAYAVDMLEEFEKLVAERDAARAEVERLRSAIGAAKSIARGELATGLELRMALLALPDERKEVD